MPSAATEPGRLRLSPEHLDQMRWHAAAEAPREACGLLLGAARADSWWLTEARPTDNDADRDDRFLISAESVWAGMRRARETGVEVLGAYHSHPEGGVTPSAADAREAWGAWLYLILGNSASHEALAVGTNHESGCQHHRFGVIAGWRWTGERFAPTPLCVTLLP